MRIAFKAPTKTNDTMRRTSSVDGEGTKEGVLGRGGDGEGSKERDKRGRH